MTKSLRTRVHLDGQWYGPGPVDDDVAERITNPKAWADGDEQTPAGVASPRHTGGPRLARRVSIDGTWYGPDDDVPPEVGRRIGNPKAWEGGRVPRFGAGGDDMSERSTSGGGAMPFEPARSFEMSPDEVRDAEGGDREGKPARVPAPPRSGKGSGKEAWETYLRASGVEVDSDANREDMIAAAEDAGLIDKE